MKKKKMKKKKKKKAREVTNAHIILQLCFCLLVLLGTGVFKVGAAVAKYLRVPFVFQTETHRRTQSKTQSEYLGSQKWGGG